MKYIVEFEDEPCMYVDEVHFYKCIQAPWWGLSEKVIKYLTPYQPDAPDTNVGNITNSCAHENDLIFRKVAIEAIIGMIDRFERILADIRESKVDDSVCGMCEYDGAYMGQSGDWCNECPGFDKDDCFKLSDKCRKRWMGDIVLPSALNNQVNLCDSCTYTYPECPSEKDDVIFGNGIGNDNICACNKYQPTVQPVATDTNVGNITNSCAHENDPISRQMAIDTIMGQPPEPHYPSWYAAQIEELSPVQPERTEYIPETKAVRSKRDCVDLSELVSATFYDQEHEEWTQQTVTIADVLDSVCDEYTILPTVQPEIIRCKDCKYRDPEDKKCDCGHDIRWQLPRHDDWHCADAERRNDDKTNKGSSC